MSFDFSAIVRRELGTPASTRNAFAAALVTVLALGFSSPTLALHGQKVTGTGTDTTNPKPAFAKTAAKNPDAHVFIQLTAPAAVTAYAAALPPAGSSSQSSAPAAAIAAGRNQIASNRMQQSTLVSAMQAAGIKYQEIYRVQRAMNGVAVIVPASQVAALRKLPGVKSVRTIVASVPTSNGSAAFVNAPQVWQGSPAQADGTGIRIGIIDTGVDYQHSNFGGTGLLADYQANDRVTLNGGVFPTPKVVGGTDLAGDNYDANGAVGSTTPVPDPNPTDCLGHGSHVAGIAGGFGVNPDGSTFAGPYDTSLPTTLRIQPGIAPKSLLYAIKVFGCGGSTDLVAQAIDWALDPNQDGDLSDHLDVINMSLGSNNGGLSELDALASDAASLSGMVVVAAAGNAGDTYFVASDPSNAARAISVAASVDGGETLFNLAITAPPPIAGNDNAVPAAFGPIIPPATLSGNLAYATPNNGCTAISGVSGNVALIDRGTCSFEVKVHNAQLAGATGVIVVQNSPAAPIVMGGDGVTPNPTISSAMISQADGANIKAQLAIPVTVTGSIVPGTSLGDTMASFSSRGPVNDMPTALKPNITAPGYNITSTLTGMTCTTGGPCFTPTANGFEPGNLAVAYSGTSMATPQVAGMVALLRQLHPTLSVEEIKALAMNSSLHDLTTLPLGGGSTYGAGRVGAGRIDAELAANLAVSAYNADGSGAVGVTFPSEISGNTTATRSVRVTNHGPTPQTFTLGIDTVVDNPGVSFSLPAGTTLTLRGHETKDIGVQMSGSANSLTHTFDPTITLTQVTASFGSLPRYWQTEETAYLTLDAGAGTLLRVPLYVAPNPTSAMTGGTTVPTGGTASGTANIPLSGTGVCTGALTPGPGCGGNFPTDEESLVTPFELQVSNPRSSDPTVTAQANLRYAGVNVDVANQAINFGVALWGPAAVPVAEQSTATEITLVAADLSTPLFTLFWSTLIDNPTNADPTNVYLSYIYDWTGNAFIPEYFPNQLPSNVIDTRTFQNDVFFLTAFLPDMGLAGTETIHYFVDTYDASGTNVDHLGPFTYNMGAPGLDFGGGVLFDDLPGAKIPVAFNVANMTANGSLGALLLHHHNAAGATAEALTVPPVTVVPPVFQSASSRKVHGAAGTFDLPLSAVPTNPTTEPRQGPAQTIVFTFDKPISAAAVTVTEGAATASPPTFSGNDVIVNLTGVTDIQYVTVGLTAVSSTDGGSGATASARVGYLAADVNQSRAVSIADVGLVNSVLSQAVTAANYLKDINASGTLTLADKAIANADLTHALPAP